jgi:AcrR family transcriptional regulator
VRLDDVAAAAQVGQGTLYIYFKSKEDLYVSLIHDGFSKLVEQIREQAAEAASPDEALEKVVRELVGFAFDHPNLFELLRTAAAQTAHRGLIQKRKELTKILAEVLARGVKAGIWSDPRPELTAVFIPGLVRSAMLYGPKDLREEVLVEQILRLVRRGMQREGK